MHTPPGENEYISVNVSLFVIYIIYTYPINPPNHPQPSATTSACNVNRRSPPSVTFDYINCVLSIPRLKFSNVCNQTIQSVTGQDALNIQALFSFLDVVL